ncbi:cupin domain-containing protein [Pseudonocardia humida]|uniref:Cupin domain-containing protein n=1 Tax=Pseudonocardia humida TaxID=2800819 RepID=A0ABT0ZS73_9PSEU|nr:cupin domain-containing protein [Pseudonocardia humida]MCO1653563.1 cupin domain-containing protein [Pseudonocardia humida]
MEPAGEADAARVSFLHRRLSASFDKRVVTVAPGARRPYRAEEWRDALVVVESGEVQLECADGGRRAFATGAVLWLAGLGLVALRNESREPAVLVAVSRRAPPADEPAEA